MKNVIIALVILWLCPISASLANDTDNADDTDENGPPVNLISPNEQDNSPLPTVTSIDAFNEGEQTADSLLMSAEYYKHNGNYQKAFELCKRALDMGYNDIDIHKTYAELLEQKLKSQKDQNHELLDQCIKEWLIVYRTEVGNEKGLSYHGINPFGHLYEDEDRSIPAGFHLQSLAGRKPKPWETDNQYIEWVNKPSTEVAGKLLTKPAENSGSK
jgi:tetratricopeptide (TPR) repeat protein